MMLRLATGLALPVDAATETFAILAKKGAGKTYTGSVWTEELVAAGVQTIVIDPVGVWWGLRSSADGKSPGLPIIILGGEHADVPLEATAGAVIADFIVESGQTCILDLSGFSKGDEIRFMTAFAERLYRRKATDRAPLHIVVDEADGYAPQRAFPEGARLLGAMSVLVRRGRSRGIGLTMITQRAAVLNKDLLTQLGCLVVLRMTSPQDRAAIQDWVSANGTPEQQKELLGSLASLPTGDAWFWAPGELDLFRRVHIRLRRTFDSSSTPKIGHKAKAPKSFADVDLKALQASIADTIERAAADDPKALRAKVAKLEKELAETRAAKEPKPDPSAGRAFAALQTVRQLANSIIERVAEAGLLGTGVAENSAALPVQSPRPTGITRNVRATGGVKATLVARDNATLAPSDHRILSVLAQYPAGRTRKQIAILAGYSANSGGFNSSLARLRAGQLVASSSDRTIITTQGIEAVGTVEQLPTGRALLDHWCGQLKPAPAAILKLLAESGPLSRAEISKATGYSANSGGFNSALARLRALELIDGSAELQISEVFQ